MVMAVAAEIRHGGDDVLEHMHMLHGESGVLTGLHGSSCGDGNG